MSSKINRTIASSPSVTVFTHGYNSSANDWLNNSDSEVAKISQHLEFKYNPNSMIDKIIRLYNVDNTILLRAKMTDYTDFNLMHIELEQNNGVVLEKEINYNFNISSQVYGKHFIILFESLQTNENPSNYSNNTAYYQFNYMLSKVLYDLKQLDPSHRIPKVNLIGHSRGGLTNLQYALDHPDIVENLISIGTPYAGSTSATIVKNQQGFKGDGLNDIINPTVYNGYKDRWNNNYNTLYKNINTVAIGVFE